MASHLTRAIVIFFSIVGAWMFADFITGVVHWAQDKLLDIETAFDLLNTFKDDNDLHHARPAAMLRFTWWENMQASAMFAWPTSLVLLLVGAPLWLWLGIFFSGFGNAVHRYAHTMRPPYWIDCLQRAGLLCTFRHHMPHHMDAGGLIPKERSTKRYCVMSMWLNPILDGTRFWYAMNWIARVK